MSYIEKEKLIKADIASIENKVRHAFNQGYDLGFKDGKGKAKPLEQESRWIPVSKLPKAGECIGNVARYYLVQNEYGDMMVASYDGIGWRQMYQHSYVKDKVVAWMPLPQKYKGRETMTREEIIKSMSLQDAIQVFKDTNCYGTMDIAKSVILKALEQEPKTGLWIDSSNGWMCSECNKDNTFDTSYCPNCGAKMEREVKE